MTKGQPWRVSTLKKIDNKFFTKSLRLRFFSNIEIKHPGSCWFWLGRIYNSYGTFHIYPFGNLQAHQVSYKLMRGDIPNGLELDHKCEVKNCVNPAHLEPVTHSENIRRGISVCGINATKTHCINGHLFDKENTIITQIYPIHRRCKTCNRNKSIKYRLKIKQ